ncbi:hypothetical protein V8C86DRAFT_2950752 [Haematococcus lacustris]
MERDMDDVKDSHPGWPIRLRQWVQRHTLQVAGGIVLCTLSLGGTSILYHKRRKSSRRASSGSQGRSLDSASLLLSDNESAAAVRIPLRDVVRFKEKQWFMEDLQNSRQGDSNAMLRVAKMYLHGQGCEKNITMAAEWLRRARYQGLHATLDELWAGTPAELAQEKQAAARAQRLQAQMAHSPQPPQPRQWRARDGNPAAAG